MNVKTLRVVGILEGISFLLLLGVAMPIKYIWDNPVAVKYIGMGHGVLFLSFLGLLLIVCHRMRWSLSVFVLGLVAAILPFAPFIFDLKLKRLEQQGFDDTGLTAHVE